MKRLDRGGRLGDLARDLALGAAALAFVVAGCFQLRQVPIGDAGPGGTGGSDAGAAEVGAGTGGTTGQPGAGGAPGAGGSAAGTGGTVTGGTGGGGGTMPAGTGGNGSTGTGGSSAGTGGATTGAGGAGAGGITTGTGGAPSGTGGAIDPANYADVQLISSCSGPRGEIFDGAWFSGAGTLSSIQPADSSGTFPMSAGGHVGTAAHVTGSVGAGDHAELGINMRLGSALFDASGYHGISFYAKAAVPLPIQVALAQENNDPTYGECSGAACYDYPRQTVIIGTAWTRYVVLFSLMVSDPLPGGGTVPVTPATIKHFQFSMPPGAFDFWVDDVYFVRAL